MANDYIRREDAIDAATQDSTENRTHSFRAGQARSASRIKALPPADVAPVVMCKDCLFFTTEKSCCRPEGLIKAREDDFCSYGERKE